jgi:hypothetical protein
MSWKQGISDPVAVRRDSLAEYNSWEQRFNSARGQCFISVYFRFCSVIHDEQILATCQFDDYSTNRLMPCCEISTISKIWIFKNCTDIEAKN